jgi:hypothetical protein
MPLTPTEVQAIASTESAKILYLSLHTADPGTTGASEATGGSPAYARKSTTVTATSGTGTSTQVTFDVPAGTYTHFGTWSAATAGTFYGGNPLSPGSQVVSSQGQVKLTITIPVTAS